MSKVKNLPPEFVETFIRHIKLMKFVGIDVFDDKRPNFFKNYLRVLVFLALIFAMLVGQMLYLSRRKDIGATFIDVINSVPGIFIILQNMTKTIVLIIQRNKIREVILKFGEVWPQAIENEQKAKEFKRWVRRVHTFDNVFFGNAIFSITMFVSIPLLITINLFRTEENPQYQFPLQLYFLCFLKSHYVYLLAYVYVSFTCTSFHMCVYMTCDFILVDLSFDLSAMLKMVQIDLENLVTPTDLQNVDINSDVDCEEIKKLVETHQKLLDLHERLNKIFGTTIFAQVSCSSVIICCYGFLAAIADGMFFRNITASLSIMWTIFILAWPGQVLSDTSLGVAEAAYRCLWYKRSKKFRKYIALIITRSQKPCILSALGFSELTLAMFSKVLSASWSYMSLLNQMYDDINLED